MDCVRRLKRYFGWAIAPSTACGVAQGGEDLDPSGLKPGHPSPSPPQGKIEKVNRGRAVVFDAVVVCRGSASDPTSPGSRIYTRKI
jgi:hypothetical protein